MKVVWLELTRVYDRTKVMVNINRVRAFYTATESVYVDGKEQWVTCTKLELGPGYEMDDGAGWHHDQISVVETYDKIKAALLVRQS